MYVDVAATMWIYFVLTLVRTHQPDLELVLWSTSLFVIPAWLKIYPMPFSSWYSCFLTLRKITFHTVKRTYFPTLILNNPFWWHLQSAVLLSIVGHIPPTSVLLPSSLFYGIGFISPAPSGFSSDYSL